MSAEIVVGIAVVELGVITSVGVHFSVNSDVSLEHSDFGLHLDALVRVGKVSIQHATRKLDSIFTLDRVDGENFGLRPVKVGRSDDEAIASPPIADVGLQNDLIVEEIERATL